MQLSIRNKMLLYIATPIVIIYMFFTGYNLFQFSSLTANHVKEKMSLLASVYAHKFNGQLREVAMIAETTARFVEHHPKLTEDELYIILKDNVLQSDLIYGGILSFEPYSYDPKLSLFSPYVYRDMGGVNKGDLKLIDLASTGFDYTQTRWEWWHIPKNTSKPIWTEPYFDDGAGEILMSTYATAFKKSNKFYGVTTIDIPLESLRDKLHLGSDENIRFSVLTKKGVFVFNPNKELINHSIYEEANKSNNSALKNHANKILSSANGFFKVNQWNNRSNQWLFYNTIESSGWTLIINVDENYIFSKLYNKIIWDAVVSFLLFIVLLVVIFYISQHLSSPVIELTNMAEKMIAGSSNKNNLGKHDEIDYLRNVFRDMRKSIDEKVSTIQLQNNTLLINKKDLEEKVKERTKELEASNLVLEKREKNLKITLRSEIHLRHKSEVLAEALHIKTDEAEQATKAKSIFLATASHDLRQPLHALMLNATILSERDNEKDEPVINNIIKSVVSLESLFDSLLDISKLDAGMVIPVKVNFSLKSILDNLLVDCKVYADEKDLMLEFPETGLCLLSDPILVERILRNLISNSIRYTKSGYISLLIVEELESICLKIIDTGIGIEEDKSEAIFEEFVQLDNPERDRGKGLGLGLSIVKRLCKLLNTSIEFESSPDTGSMFYFSIPKGDCELVKYPVAENSDLIRETLDHFVVIIDDEKSIREGLQHLLESWGCTVLSFGSEQEAINKLKEYEYAPDVLLVDYRLRENKTGIEAIHAVTDLFKEDIPALIITGDTASDRLLEAESSGYQLLHKPLPPSQLRMFLQKISTK